MKNFINNKAEQLQNINSKITVHEDDLLHLNTLTEEADESRRTVTGVLLTVYGAATSGLFFLVTDGELHQTQKQKALFLSVSTTSVVIVLLCLLEKLIDYFAKVSVGKHHVNNIKNQKTYNQTGKYNLLKPNYLISISLKYIPIMLLISILLNSLTVLGYIFSIVI